MQCAIMVHLCTNVDEIDVTSPYQMSIKIKIVAARDMKAHGHSATLIKIILAFSTPTGICYSLAYIK